MSLLMKVYLVEDSPLIQNRLSDVIGELSELELVGVSAAENDAIKGIDETLPDLIVLDLNLAQGNGMGVLWHVKQKYPETKMIVLTNMADMKHRKRCQQLGADYYFDKSKDLGALIGAMAAIQEKYAEKNKEKAK